VRDRFCSLIGKIASDCKRSMIEWLGLGVSFLNFQQLPLREKEIKKSQKGYVWEKTLFFAPKLRAIPLFDQWVRITEQPLTDTIQFCYISVWQNISIEIVIFKLFRSRIALPNGSCSGNLQKYNIIKNKQNIPWEFREFHRKKEQQSKTK
jgi:hypothetical protein